MKYFYVECNKNPIWNGIKIINGMLLNSKFEIILNYKFKNFIKVSN